ncbi:MAG TPA: isocitrate lyase/phosphoenolpyruvate mutase family protein [Hyphomicrobiaceae bacterium]|nr:isocitrate lyase/phosphoenolpyruvate mutase family protein [Hyphomicrobiaceae bacterium]
MTAHQTAKAQAFRALHGRGSAFIIPNPWDVSSARILTGLGFEALATSSGAAAGTFGRRDGGITRAQSLANARAIVEATDLPVAADLENGFGHGADEVALTIREASGIGLVGGSIEDCTGGKDGGIYPIDVAVARIKAAAAAVGALPVPFVLTARAENFIRGRPDLDDTIARLKAYEAAGAEVLFAPGLPDITAVKRVCSALTKPFNFMVGIKGKSFSFAELESAGVVRVSLATSLYRAAMTGLIEAAREARDKGTFGFVDRSLPTPDINAALKA